MGLASLVDMHPTIPIGRYTEGEEHEHEASNESYSGCHGWGSRTTRSWPSIVGWYLLVTGLVENKQLEMRGQLRL